MTTFRTKKLPPEERDAMLRRRILACAKEGQQCWLWDGATDQRGYATLGNRRMSRHSYRLFIGPLPQDRLACHRCDTPRCVNFNHLFAGTQLDNMRDAARKGRLVQKISNETVREIRTLLTSGHKIAHLARRFHVHKRLIHGIKTGSKRAEA